MNESGTIPPFWTVTELHAFIGRDRISERSLYEAIRRGDLASLRLGRRLLIPSAPIVSLMNGRANLDRTSRQAAEVVG